jgi:PAS domain-containing protein
MGLVLQTHPDVAPASGDAFLVCDARLRVCALSRGAEDLLGIGEPHAIHRPVDDLVTGVARGPDGLPALPGLLREAAAGLVAIARTTVAPWGRRADACPARVGACGGPPAALLLLDAPLP